MAYISQISPDNGTTVYKITDSLYGTCPTAANTAAKLVTCADFNELVHGTTIRVYMTNNNTAANATLNVNGTGAVAIKRYGTTNVGTDQNSSWVAGSIITFLYDKPESTSTPYWRVVDYSLRNNDNTYDRTRYNQAIKAKSAIVAANIIVANDETGYFHLKTGSAFDITYPILYAASAINANATGTNNYICIPFTVTTTQSLTLTAYKPVYIKGKLSGTIFTPVSTTPLTQTEPTSADGYQYLLLGTAYSTTALYLLPEHRIYEYIGGKIRLYSQYYEVTTSDTYDNVNEAYENSKIIALKHNSLTYYLTYKSSSNTFCFIHLRSGLGTYAWYDYIHLSSSGFSYNNGVLLTNGGYTSKTAINGPNQEVHAGTVTPNITIPSPTSFSTVSNEVRYIFTAASANATFKAPSGVKLTDGETTTAAAGSIAYTNLTAGKIYECSFAALSATLIALVMKEWPAS